MKRSRSRDKRAAYLLGGILALLVLLSGWGLLRGVGAGPNSTGTGDTALLPIGSRAPDFTQPDIDGQPVQLAALRGRPVWINFWATWCPPCKAEMPRIEDKYRQYQAQGLVVLGVDVQEDPAVVRSWIENRFHWRFLIDRDLALANRYDLDGLPGHVFIDRAGIVRGRYAGELDAAQMDAQLAAILPP